MTVLQVFLLALLTAVATGLGALPFLFIRKVSKRFLGLANAVAAGLMITASFQLIYEGSNHGMMRVIIGVLVGLVLIIVSQRLIGNLGTALENRQENGHDHDHDHSHDHDDDTPHTHLHLGILEGASARQALLMIGVMTIHSFAEGVGVGVSFGDGFEFGLFITLAIAIHNIPEGIAISLVLVPKGVPVWRAALWSIFSSLPQPLIAVPAFLFVEVFTPFLPFGLGLAAGAMIWLAVAEIMPEAFEAAPHEQVATVFTVSVAAMVVFQALIG